MKFAAIDIGSNALRLLVSSVNKSKGRIPLKKIALTRVPVRLGADVFSEGRISEENIERVIKTLEAFKLLMDVHEVVDYRACATSAMREAENGEEVARSIEERTGVRVERIDGPTESELIVSTYLKRISDSGKDFLYVDVGGGSTEVTLVSDGKAERSRSFPIGTVRSLQNEVSEEDWKELAEWCRSFKGGAEPLTALGTGGNINKLCNLLGIKKEKPIPRKKLEKMAKRLRSLSYQERMDEYDLKPDRADVIVPATGIYLQVLRESGIEEIIVPKVGLADGIITHLYSKHYA